MNKNLLFSLALLFASLFCGAQIPELWGVASNFGEGNVGTIFKLNGDGSGFDTACSLQLATGSFPAGHLVMNGDGLFYGTAFQGGSNNSGTLFSVDPVTNTFIKLYDLDSMGNSWVNSDLVRANDTTLYGIKYQAGTAPYTGRIFRFNPLTNSYTTIYSFTERGQGLYPRNIIRASDGMLYGTTDVGGEQERGTLFSFDPATATYTALHHFDSTTTLFTTGITDAGNNLLYGLTAGGSISTYGTIFSFNLSSNTFTTLFSFNDTTGFPAWHNRMIKGRDGKLYGILYGGGANNEAGTLFSFNPVGNIFQKLFDFGGLNGTDPVSTLVQAADDYLYGQTSHGGTSGKGVVFSFNITDSNYTVLKNLSEATGGGSYGGLTELALPTGIAEQTLQATITVYPNPATDELHISSEERFTAYAIYSVTGQVVRNSTLPATGTLPINGMPSGTYLLEVKNKSVAARKLFVVGKQ